MTNTFNFDLPEDRFDYDLANEGVWIPVRDEKEQLVLEMKVKLQDDSNPRHRAAKERYFKTHANRRSKMTEFQRLVDQFVELSATDWRGVKQGGKDVPFSKEAATAYLNIDKLYFVIEMLWPQSHNVLRFQAEGVESKDEIAGN